MLTKAESKRAQNSFLFKGVPFALSSQLLSHSYKRSIRRGETLFLQGDPALRIYVILAGCLKLVRLTPGGEEIVVAIYSDGDSFGEAAALQGGLYPVTVDAVQDSTLIQIDAQILRNMLRKDPNLGMVMLGATFGHLHQLVTEIENLKALSGIQRLVSFLISLTPIKEGACTLVLPYDKVLIANQLGMKPESLSRSFANLRSRGVTVERQSVAVSDIAQLRALLSEEPGHFSRRLVQ